MLHTSVTRCASAAVTRRWQMDYEDACEAIVTREEARREIARHDIDGTFADFLAEVGDRAEYSGGEVLGWLGY